MRNALSIIAVAACGLAGGAIASPGAQSGTTTTGGSAGPAAEVKSPANPAGTKTVGTASQPGTASTGQAVLRGKTVAAANRSGKVKPR